MNAKRLFPVLCTAALVTSACASGIPFLSTSTPTATNTPKPTSTPTATATALPTETPSPMPTETLVPLDKPVSIRAITLKFINKKVTKDTVKMLSYQAKPPDGYSVLVVEASYTGDLPKFALSFGGTTNALYIDDGSGATNGMDSIFWDSHAHIAFMIFFVKTGTTSFILNNRFGSPWSMDLTSLP